MKPAQIVKPDHQRADDKTMQELIEQLASLKAKRVAAFPAKDLAPFGLNVPDLRITLTDKDSQAIGTILAGALMPADGARWVWAAAGIVFLIASVIGYLLAREPTRAPAPAAV